MLIMGELQKGTPSGKNSFDMASIIEKASSDKAKAWLLKTSVEDDGSIKEEPKRQLEDCCKRVFMTSRLKKETSILLKKLNEAEKKGDRDGFKTLADSYLSMKRG